MKLALSARLAAIVLRGLRRVEPACVRHWLRLRRVRTSNRLLAVAGFHPPHARRDRRLRPGRHGREDTAVGRARFEIAKLPFQVCLEPAAVLALECTQVVDAALEFLAGLHERAHRLAVTLLRVALQALGPCPGIAGDLLGLPPGLGQDLVCLAPGTTEGLVGL